MGFLDSVISAVSSPAGIGGLVSGGLGLIGQLSANSSNQSSSNNQMGFQASQSGSQYQRAVADMKAAGINPMLASQVGGNAAASGSSASFGNAGTAATNSGLQGAMLAANLKQVKANTAAAASQAALNTTTADKVKQDTQTSAAMANMYSTQSALNSVTYNRVLTEIDLNRGKLGLNNNEIQLVKAQVHNAYLTGSNIQADTGNKRVDNVLKQLSINAATNSSNMASTPWGRFVPFLDSFTKSVSPFSSAFTNSLGR